MCRLCLLLLATIQLDMRRATDYFSHEFKWFDKVFTITENQLSNSAQAGRPKVSLLKAGISIKGAFLVGICSDPLTVEKSFLGGLHIAGVINCDSPKHKPGLFGYESVQ